MIASLEDLRAVLKLVFPDRLPPKPLHLVEAAGLVREGTLSAAEAAKQAGATVKGVLHLTSNAAPLAAIFGLEATSLPSPFEARARRL